LDADVTTRVLLLMHGKGVPARPHADMADVLASVVLGIGLAKPFGDVVAVSPGLHEPSGLHRGGTHRWTEPRQLLAGRNFTEGRGQRGAAALPPGQLLGG